MLWNFNHPWTRHLVSSRISITLLAAVYRRPMDPLKMDALILKQTKLGVDWHSIFHGKILFLGEKRQEFRTSFSQGKWFFWIRSSSREMQFVAEWCSKIRFYCIATPGHIDRRVENQEKKQEIWWNRRQRSAKYHPGNTDIGIFLWSLLGGHQTKK